MLDVAYYPLQLRPAGGPLRRAFVRRSLERTSAFYRKAVLEHCAAKVGAKMEAAGGKSPPGTVGIARG